MKYNLKNASQYNYTLLTLLSGLLICGSPVSAQEGQLDKKDKEWCLQSSLPKPQENLETVEWICREQGTLQTLNYLFSESRRVSQRYDFDQSEKLIRYTSFDSQGHEVLKSQYTPVGEDMYVAKSKVEEQDLLVTLKIKVLPRFEEQTMRKQYYKSGKLFREENYQTQESQNNVLSSTRLVDESGDDWFFRLTPAKEHRSYLKKFDVYLNRKFHGKYDYVKEYDFNQNQIQRAQKLKPVVVIDTGLDWTHRALKDKIAFRSGYGVFENFKIGWSFDRQFNLDSPQVQEYAFYNHSQFPFMPFSHGTHVSGLMMKDVDQHGLIAFVGDYSDPDYLEKIGRWLKASDVRFVNMSFGFGERVNPFAANAPSRSALVRMMEDNPQILFFVAAGNSSANLDDPENDDVPAKANIKNKFVIAAIDTDEIELNKRDQYKLTHFSSFGKQTVDIAAPGQRLLSSNFAQTNIRVSGTSMATPYVLNVFLRMLEINPNLTNDELQKIVERTVFIPREELAVKTKGFVHRERALEVARLTHAGEKLDQAIHKALRLY